MNQILAIFIIALGMASPAVAAKKADPCSEAGSAEVPASDRPTPEEIKAFENSEIACVSYQAGVGVPQDWDKYRKCALSHEFENDKIAEIYANGWGVKRNANLAIALACQASNIPDVRAGMVSALYRTKHQKRL